MDTREKGLFKKIMRQTDDDKLSTYLAKFIVWIAVFVTPTKYWYSIAYNIANIFSTISRKALWSNWSIKFQRAQRLNRLLSFFTRSGRPFDIPLKITGLELLDNTTNGVAICSVHLPLIKVGIRAILDSGFQIDAMIAAKSSPDGKMAFWGTNKRVPIIPTINASVLIKTRSILKNNGCTTLMIDTHFGRPLSPNMLRFCGKTGTKVVFLLAELLDDHSVAIQLIAPPFPYCEDEDKVFKNLTELDRLRSEILTRYKQKDIRFS